MSRILHPNLDPAERRELFLEGIRLFNTGEYYACHEAFEEIWRSTTPEPKDLFQGLIQVGVGLYHYFERQRPDVARRVLIKGRLRLTPLLPESHGLDLVTLVASVVLWEAWLEEPRGKPPEVPRIVVLDDAKVR